MRLAAVEHLEDQVLLAKIAKNAPDSDARLAAVGRLEYQDLLAEVAKTCG